MDYEPVIYIGIDFVLKTRKPAEKLTAELAKHIHFNKVWRGCRIIVINGLSQRRNLDSEINAFCDLIENLSSKGLRCWKDCSSRLIDIGIDSGNVRGGDKFVPLDLQIDPDTLKRISIIRAKLVITVYPHVIETEATIATAPKLKVNP